MRLVVFGPQGAGKGTQSQRISEKFEIPAIATGDIFRWAISSGTEFGGKVKSYVESGQMVPDDLTIEIIRQRLSEDDVQNGFLLDGFPRNLFQADALDRILAEQGYKLDAALVLEVPQEVSERRILGRRMCSQCGRNYHIDNPPKSDWTCDVCGGDVVRRQDDKDDEKVRQRLRLYHEQTEPLKARYADKGILREVEGQGTPHDVFARITAVL
ncbi:MAG: adenylate kinase [Actinobacteria bacterium]|nr:adenylate kinase [Actinomycetota bacterium]